MPINLLQDDIGQISSQPESTGKPINLLEDENQPFSVKSMAKISENIPGPIGIISKIGNRGSNAIKQIGSDLLNSVPGAYKSIIHGIGGIPGAVDYLKENVPKSINLVNENPSAAGRSAAAGGTEFLGKISNIPPALARYLVHIGMISPETYESMAKPPSQDQFRQWANRIEGEEQPGGELIRGGLRNAENIYGGAKLASLMNPLRYTKGSIARDVIHAEARQQGIHNEAYNNLWNQAAQQGHQRVNFNPARIDIGNIQRYPNENFTISTENFLNNPTLENAHIAQSDLGKMIRAIRKNPTVVPPSEVRNITNAAQNAQNYIRDRMFRDANGTINRNLADRYNVITDSYRRNVIPYTTNKALQDFKRENITLDQLIPALKKGKFARMRGAYHPEISRRDLIAPVLKYGGLAEGVHLLGLDQTLLNRLMEKE